MAYKVNKIQKVSHNCIVCGLKNEASLKSQFLETDYDGRNILVGMPAVRFIHQSYPNRMHGGVIGALLDETVGRAIQIRDESLWGVTGELNIRYKRPVPLDKQIYVLGLVTQENSRMFEGEGKIILAETGEVLATASGKYVILPTAKICGDDFLHNEWIKDVRPFPQQVELPYGFFK